MRSPGAPQARTRVPPFQLGPALNSAKVLARFNCSRPGTALPFMVMEETRRAPAREVCAPAAAGHCAPMAAAPRVGRLRSCPRRRLRRPALGALCLCLRRGAGGAAVASAPPPGPRGARAPRAHAPSRPPRAPPSRPAGPWPATFSRSARAPASFPLSPSLLSLSPPHHRVTAKCHPSCHTFTRLHSRRCAESGDRYSRLQMA